MSRSQITDSSRKQHPAVEGGRPCCCFFVPLLNVECETFVFICEGKVEEDETDVVNLLVIFLDGRKKHARENQPVAWIAAEPTPDLHSPGVPARKYW